MKAVNYSQLKIRFQIDKPHQGTLYNKDSTGK